MSLIKTIMITGHNKEDIEAFCGDKLVCWSITEVAFKSRFDVVRYVSRGDYIYKDADTGFLYPCDAQVHIWYTASEKVINDLRKQIGSLYETRGNG
jgi:hypothetical protein